MHGNQLIMNAFAYSTNSINGIHDRNDIILNKHAVAANLKHITKCMEFLSKYSDRSLFEARHRESLSKLQNEHELLVSLEQKQCELQTKQKQLSEKEEALNEAQQACLQRQRQLDVREKWLKSQEKKHKHNVSALQEDEQFIQEQKKQQSQQLAFLISETEKNTKYAQELKERETELLEREREFLKREHNLYQREKEVVQKEHTAKLYLSMTSVQNQRQT
eukprot:CAMPEP_0197023220 /NCGR_PEP_ID=MMETSP1384-20130603/3989_1 /TAXON_ID=29189 /ORGANISM="Ammonia sp." /LENGTH=219 /DNA_ID=CAMNT_0042451411 /DNA_START=20 /DNA_END=679 /DNA_ORIENTATION=-